MFEMMEEAYRFRLENKIYELPLRFETLLRYLRRNCCQLIPYSEADAYLPRYPEIQPLLLSLEAFTLFTSTGTLVFLSDELAHARRLFVLAHEIAHIYLKHSRHGFLGFQSAQGGQEQDADQFARCLIAPPCLLEKSKLRTVEEVTARTQLLGEEAEKLLSELPDALPPSVPGRKLLRRLYIRRSLCRNLLLVLVPLLLLGGGLYLQYLYSPSDALLTPFLEERRPETVYVTVYGEHYHRADCFYAKNGVPLVLDDAIRRLYEPCALCFPAD